MNTQLPTYLKLEEAAEKMGLKVATVRRLAANNEIPALVKGRGKQRKHYLIHRDALEGVEG
jgi:excisionase family DNA binding protein